MAEPSSLVQGCEKLLSVFGRWPSFHDAEVIEVCLWRGDVDPDRQQYVFPSLTLKLHAFEYGSLLDPGGFLVHIRNTLVTLRFHDLEEDFQLTGFNHQNAIFGLAITEHIREVGPSPYLAVEIEPSFGMGAIFKCQRIEVLDASPCDGKGNAVHV